MVQFKNKWSFSVKNWNQGNFNGQAPRNNNFSKALELGDNPITREKLDQLKPGED